MDSRYGSVMARCPNPGCHEQIAESASGRSLGRCVQHSREARQRGSNGGRIPSLGERAIKQGGYIGVYTDAGWKMEHRLVMESVLGRPLIPGVESVHHRNGVRDDNDPSNLELWVGGIRYGQRASDIRCPHCGQPYA